MSEERRQILQILAEGKITPDEAEQLIAALEREQPGRGPAAPPDADARQRPRRRYLRVVVDKEADGADGTPGQVNVRIPLQLLRAGVRLTSLVPPGALGKLNAELSRSGVPIDLTQLKPQHIDDLVEHLDDMTVDVGQADARVKVYFE